MIATRTLLLLILTPKFLSHRDLSSGICYVPYVNTIPPFKADCYAVASAVVAHSRDGACPHPARGGRSGQGVAFVGKRMGASPIPTFETKALMYPFDHVHTRKIQ